ncbi:MAG: salt stress protein, Slr1339 family [Prochlorotrichaceae cyanobacterium]
MGNIEDLLASIKADKDQSPPPQNIPEQQKQASAQSPLPSSHSVDDLLEQLGEPSPQRSFALDSVLGGASPTSPPQDTKPPQAKPLDLRNLPPPSRTSSSNPPSPALSSSTLPVLETLKAEFLAEQRQREAQERAEQERLAREREAALKKERQRQEQEAKEKQARLTKAAEQWLNQLEPLSGEAIWFDEFSTHYNSRLEAAIAYLNLES